MQKLRESESESHSVMSDSAIPGTVHGIFQARILEWLAFSFSRGSSLPRDRPRSPTLQADSLPAEPQGKPKAAENWAKRATLEDIKYNSNFIKINTTKIIIIMLMDKEHCSSKILLLPSCDPEVMGMKKKDIYSGGKGGEKLIPSRWHLQAVILVLTWVARPQSFCFMKHIFLSASLC